MRTPDAILVLETKRYGGIISGVIDGRTWTQRFDHGPERFEVPNPIRQNRRHSMAAGSAVFEGELRGVLIPFSDMGSIVTGSTVLEHPWLDAAWLKLQAVAAESPTLREVHRRELETRNS